MKKVVNNWFIPAPWGKIAIVSWGYPAGECILLCHGRQDSVATFIPLLDLLPNEYYYVGFDLPGHGLSDPFPIGVTLTRFHFVTALEVVVRHLGWKRFVYLAHSMGAELGLFYNSIHPNEITKFIHLDSGPALQSLQIHPIPDFYKYFYEYYYSNYDKTNNDDRVYSKRKALDAVMNARNMSEKQAEVILSRNLRCIGDDRYKLSWDRRLKRMPSLNLQNEQYLKLFKKNSPPTLFIIADGSAVMYTKKGAEKLIADMARNCKHFHVKNVQGTHDVHFTNPERVGKYICDFLDKDFGCKSKL